MDNLAKAQSGSLLSFRTMADHGETWFAGACGRVHQGLSIYSLWTEDLLESGDIVVSSQSLLLDVVMEARFRYSCEMMPSGITT